MRLILPDVNKHATGDFLLEAGELTWLQLCWNRALIWPQHELSKNDYCNLSTQCSLISSQYYALQLFY